MTVKEMLGNAARLVGEKDVSDFLSDAVPDDRAYAEESATLLKHCYDVVVDELACEYLPLKKTESFDVSGGKIPFCDFSEKPIAIDCVKDGNGNKLAYSTIIDCLEVNARKVSVTYGFKPKPQDLADEAYYADGIIGEHVLSYGIAAEYCLERGRLSDAEIWNAKYAGALKARLAEKRRLKIKVGKWC